MVESLLNLSIIIFEVTFEGANCVYLGLKAWVLHIKGSEDEIAGGLDDRVVAGEDVEGSIQDVTGAELRAGNG